MAFTRVFMDEDPRPMEESGPLPLAESDLHHLVNVVRKRTGDRIIGVTPDGTGLLFEIETIDRHTLVGRLVETIAQPRIPRVTLFQGVAKGERMELVIRMATELGVTAVVPVLTERSIVVLEGPKAVKRGERWRSIARAAAEQSGRFDVPEVSDPVGLVEATALLAGFDRVLVAWEEASAGSISDALSEVSRDLDPTVAVFVGPEGGFSVDEVDSITKAGARVVSLGDTILRTETAGVVATALALSAMGGLGASRA